MRSMGQQVLIGIIRFYRWWLSPWIGTACRFYPTCSEYGLQALEEHGCFKGIWLIIKRLSCCHPFHNGGVDPVPRGKRKI